MCGEIDPVTGAVCEVPAEDLHEHHIFIEYPFEFRWKTVVLPTDCLVGVGPEVSSL